VNPSAGECGDKDQVSRTQPAKRQTNQPRRRRCNASVVLKEVQKVDVFVLGRKQTVPDEVRSLAQAKVARLARLTPLSSNGRSPDLRNRDTSGVARQCVRSR